MAEQATKEKATKAPKATEKSASTKAAPQEFAVIETGGKQYMVAEGSVVKIEKLKKPAPAPAPKGSKTSPARGEFSVGDEVVFDKVLLVDNGADETTIGAPYIAGATVSAEITKINRAKKVTVIKYKAKSNYFKKRGHRQPFFEVKITKLG